MTPTPIKDPLMSKYTLKGKRWGFICGTESSLSLIYGLLSRNVLRPENILISDENVNERNYSNLKKFKLEVIQDHQEVIDSCPIVVLDLLPDTLKLTLVKLKRTQSFLLFNHIFVSMVAGISTYYLEELLKELFGNSTQRVIRLLVNKSCSIAQGCCAYAPGRYADDKDKRFMEENLSQIGIFEKIDDCKLDALSCIAISGQSFIYTTVEAIVDGGVKLGLNQNMALKFAINSALGSLKMLLPNEIDSTTLHPAKLKISECAQSPSTAEAMHYLEKQAFRGSLMSAVEAAFLRARKDAQKEIDKAKPAFSPEPELGDDFLKIEYCDNSNIRRLC